MDGRRVVVVGDRVRESGYLLRQRLPEAACRRPSRLGAAAPAGERKDGVPGYEGIELPLHSSATVASGLSAVGGEL